ncbi:MAG: hypothetical protein WCD29_04765, partial [Pseudolabrys sp.]
MRQTPRSTSVAAQLDDGAPRALTTTAARAQSSAKASTSNAIDARRPSASRPIQPIASQVTPVFRMASFGVRASAPAASHSLTAKVSRLLRNTESRPSGPRMATVWPSSATSTSGRGDVTAQRL